MLTDKAVRVAASRDKASKLADGRGLHLHVSASGHKSWRYKYRFEYKERLLTFGAYPELSLADAREKRDEAKKILRTPRHSAKRSRLIGRNDSARSFEEVARAWHALQVARWKPVHANDVITSLERDVFPHIGAMPLAEIDKPLLLSVLRKVEKRGAIETARRIKQRVSAIYRYANAEGAGLENPATDINDALTPLPPAKRYPALADIDAIRTMIGDIDRAGASPVNRHAAGPAGAHRTASGHAPLHGMGRHHRDRLGRGERGYERGTVEYAGFEDQAGAALAHRRSVRSSGAAIPAGGRHASRRALADRARIVRIPGCPVRSQVMWCDAESFEVLFQFLGESDFENRSRIIAPVGDIAIMRPRDSANDGKAEAGAVRRLTSARELLKRTFFQFRREAGP